MSNKIPPEIDSLMWGVVDDGSPQAVQEFESRYPSYRSELKHRLAMVQGLKGKGRQAHQRRVIPAFVIREPKRSESPKAITVTSVLVLAALAVASFTATSMLAPKPAPVVTHHPPAQTQPPLAVQTPNPATNPAGPTAPPKVADPPADPDAGTPKQAEIPPYLKPSNVKIKRAPLLDALKLITAQGGLRLVVGPGMPNPDVEIDYQDKNTIQMLKDLGHQYAFTAFDQHDGSVIVIPAVDPKAPATDESEDSADSHRRIGQ